MSPDTENWAGQHDVRQQFVSKVANYSRHPSDLASSLPVAADGAKTRKLPKLTKYACPPSSSFSIVIDDKARSKAVSFWANQALPWSDNGKKRSVDISGTGTM